MQARDDDRALPRWPGWLLATALAALGGCSGVLTPSSNDGDESGNGSGLAGASEAPRVARLSHAQWEQTVQDLFSSPAPFGLSATFLPDPAVGHYSNNIQRLGVSAGLWAQYQTAAETIAEKVTADPTLLEGLRSGLPTDQSFAAAFVTRFGRRAFRRTLFSDEVTKYSAVFAQGANEFSVLEASTAGIRLVVETMLQSPHFLDRLELSTVVKGDTIPLNGFEIATRLSYALWNTMPDGELLDAAENGELDTDAGIKKQAARLFDNIRARAQLDQFYIQTYSIDEYSDVDKNTTIFPAWSRNLAEAMGTEMTLFLQDVTASGGGIRDLLTSTHSFVNSDLAALYGIFGSFGGEFSGTDLGPSRPGMLTRLGFLARNGSLERSDPIHRGVFVNRKLLCRDLIPVANLPENLMPTGTTTREKIDSITGPGTCGASCHATIINPVGFAMENFDAVGVARSDDGGKPVDTSGSYTFEDGRSISFANVGELANQLAEAPEVHSCYVRQLLEFVYGRNLNDADQVMVKQLAKRSRDEKVGIRDLLLELVTSPSFRTRAKD